MVVVREDTNHGSRGNSFLRFTRAVYGLWFVRTREDTNHGRARTSPGRQLKKLKKYEQQNKINP